jgi:hypothetical protein
MDYTIILFILILLVLITLFGFFIYRLINKLDKYENIIMEQDQILTGLREAVRYSSEKLKEHDTKGHYSSDDDLGNYFRTLLEVDKVITEYIGLISNEETESRE